MNRREVVKAAGGVIVSRKLGLLGFDLKCSIKHVVFFDPKLMGADFADRSKDFPPDTVLCSVQVPHGKTLDDVIRIFEERPE